MIGDLVADTHFAVLRLPDYLRVKKISFLRPFCEMHLSAQNFEIKIANETDELLQVLRLRFDVFFREFASRKIRFSFIPYDIDQFDLWCDHLIVKDKRTHKVVAAYRLLHSGVKRERFYSESEFQFPSLLKLDGEKIELGRACVHRDYRNGEVMGLLLKGLLRYARVSGAKYLFGCSSLQRKEFKSFSETQASLSRRNAFLEEGVVAVQRKSRIKNFPEIEAELSRGEAGNGVGSLLHLYLMAGAKLGPEAAYDPEMDCLDLFTWIDLQGLSPSFEKRFSC